MCTIWDSRGRFGPKRKSKFWPSVTFAGFTSILLPMLIVLLSLRGMWNMGLKRPKFLLVSEICKYVPQMPIFGPFWTPKVSQNSGIWSLYQKVFNGFTSELLHMLIASTFKCVENMGLRGPILGDFGSQNKSIFRSLVISSKIFHWFRISVRLHVSYV